MNKITADHLARRAVVYIRQSTPEQVRYNLESQRRQYGLVDRARELGWHDIDVIDDDLGRSGDGRPRAGFDRLLRAVCEGHVGAVFSSEASRLARNGREWHTLLEFCGVVDALLIDAEAVYAPTLTNDRLLLGMNRPDSYHTSCSTSRGSVNLLEIFLCHQLPIARPLRQTSRPDMPTYCDVTDRKPCASLASTNGVSVSESSRDPP